MATQRRVRSDAPFDSGCGGGASPAGGPAGMEVNGFSEVGRLLSQVAERMGETDTRGPSEGVLARTSRRILGSYWHVRIASLLRPPETDLTHYERLIGFIEEHDLTNLDGDFLELGAFLGGGTRKLARFAARHGRSVHVVDTFDMDFQEEPELWHLRNLGPDQWSVFKKQVKGLRNVIAHRTDSRLLQIPGDARFCFAFIDGAHTPEMVVNDWEKVWPHMVPGGVMALHDYDKVGGRRPYALQIDKLLKAHACEVADTVVRREEATIFVQKEPLDPLAEGSPRLLARVGSAPIPT